MSIFDLIKSGDTEGLKRLLAESPEVAQEADENGVSAILLALYHGKRDLAELLAPGIDLTIHEASAFGDLSRVRSLLDSDPSLLDSYAPDGFFPLALSLFFGRDDVADELLKRGADVNQQARNGQKIWPIHAAIGGGRSLDLIRALLDRGADVEAMQQAGVRPIHNAAAVGRIEVLELLLQRGASPVSLMDDGSSAAVMAEKRGHPEAAVWLRKMAREE